MVGFITNHIICMKTLILFLFVGYGLITNLFAQSTGQTIRGVVLDQESKTPLIGANVIVIGTEPILAAATDLEGHFRIVGVPLGRHSLRITYIGYEETTLPEILVGAGKEVVLEIALQESLLSVSEITVVAETEKGVPLNEMALVSARSFSVDETKRYAAAVNDPSRMALSFAGVAANDDTGNEIIIRGNSPRGLLWRLEGVEIPSPNHFSEEGASGGAISILSVNMLDNSDFFTGAFPAEYGNAASGVFDIRLRKGNSQKREYALQAGVLGLDFAAEGPFRKGNRASYLVNYRYSTLAILNAIGFNLAGETVPKFQDLAFKLHLPTQKAGLFTLWGIGGQNTQDILADRDVNRWERMGDRFDNYINNEVWATGLNHTLYLGEDTYLESILSFSGTHKRYQADSLSPALDVRLHYQEEFTNAAVRASVLLHKKFSARHSLRSGLIVSRLGFDLFAQREDETRPDYQIKTLAGREGSAWLYQAYAQWKYRLRSNLTFLAGLHGLHFGLNGRSTLEPRAGLQWQFTSRQSLSLGFGQHSRTESLITYFAQETLPDNRTITPNQNLDFTRALHYVLGYQHRLSDDLILKLEVYYQDLRRVPIYSASTTDPELLTGSPLNAEEGFLSTDSLFSEGKGRNYGLELTPGEVFYSQLLLSVYRIGLPVKIYRS
ncbi:MAG: hypothetical protein OHK0053_33090 [Microscillaceae bacterium]